MKIYYLSALAICCFFTAYGQNTFPTTGSVGIGTASPTKALEVNGDTFVKGIQYQFAADRQSRHGISWYHPDYRTWITYMAPSGAGNSPFGDSPAPLDAAADVTSWALRSNIEDAPGYGWIFESGQNGVGHNATVKFAINSNNGTFHSYGNGIIDGNVGIGTSSPENIDGWERVLEVKGISHAKSVVSSSDIQTGIWSHVLGYYGAPAGGITGTSSDHPFSIMTNKSTKMTIASNGDVGIGTITPKEKLSVNGKIRAHEIKVETANWPDYVFAKDYQLPSLDDTEKYIKEKGHLSGIPSAEEVKNNGIDLGDMNAKLLKKIEELTLHLIEMEKRAKLRDEKYAKEIAILRSQIK
jgi:hypothetical protein